MRVCKFWMHVSVHFQQRNFTRISEQRWLWCRLLHVALYCCYSCCVQVVFQLLECVLVFVFVMHCSFLVLMQPICCYTTCHFTSLLNKKETSTTNQILLLSNSCDIIFKLCHFWVENCEAKISNQPTVAWWNGRKGLCSMNQKGKCI